MRRAQIPNAHNAGMQGLRRAQDDIGYHVNRIMMAAQQQQAQQPVAHLPPQIAPPSAAFFPPSQPVQQQPDFYPAGIMTASLVKDSLRDLPQNPTETEISQFFRQIDECITFLASQFWQNFIRANKEICKIIDGFDIQRPLIQRQLDIKQADIAVEHARFLDIGVRRDAGFRNIELLAQYRTTYSALSEASRNLPEVRERCAQAASILNILLEEMQRQSPRP